MKIRSGFVSNSSSSSFIIGVPPQKPCPTCGHIENDILGEIEESGQHDGESSIIAEGFKTVLESATLDMDLDGDESNSIKEKVEKYHKKYPKNTIVYVSISNHNSPLQEKIAEFDILGSWQ